MQSAVPPTWPMYWRVRYTVSGRPNQAPSMMTSSYQSTLRANQPHPWVKLSNTTWDSAPTNAHTGVLTIPNRCVASPR